MIGERLAFVGEGEPKLAERVLANAVELQQFGLGHIGELVEVVDARVGQSPFCGLGQALREAASRLIAAHADTSCSGMGASRNGATVDASVGEEKIS
jgi:hypothetical protein